MSRTATAAAELEAALTDPIDALLARALRIWGQDIPVESLADIQDRTGARRPALRSRQHRLIDLMRSADQLPQPLFTEREVVRLRDLPDVVGELSSLTWTHAQIQLTDSSWISVPHADVVRVFDPPPPVDPALTRAQQVAARMHQRRRELQRARLRARRSTTTSTT